MTEQSTALRLADELLWIKHTADWTACERAAAELRRQHQEIIELLQYIDGLLGVRH